MTRESPPSFDDAPTAWWSTVSPNELAASSELASGLLNPAQHPPGGDPTVLARALVIQQLFVHETLLRDLLVEANERFRNYSRVDKTSDLTEAIEWLAHCALLKDVFAQSLEMLASEDEAMKTLLDKFVKHVSTLQGHLAAVVVSKGTSKDLFVSRPIKLRQRGPR